METRESKEGAAVSGVPAEAIEAGRRAMMAEGESGPYKGWPVPPSWAAARYATAVLDAALPSLREQIAAEVLGPVRALADATGEWRTYESRDTGTVYAAEKIDDWIDDLRSTVSAPARATETAADGWPTIPVGPVMATSLRPYRQGTPLVAVSESEWEDAEQAMSEAPRLQDALANTNAAARRGQAAEEVGVSRCDSCSKGLHAGCQGHRVKCSCGCGDASDGGRIG